MNSLVLKKVSGVLFLVGAIFIIIGSVVALSEDETVVNADFVILNLLCVILLISAGVLTFLLRFEIPLFYVIGTYVGFNVIYSFYYAFKYDWWQAGIFFSLKYMSAFLLPTGFIFTTSPSSILIDITNLSVIVGAVLLFMSLNTSDSHIRTGALGTTSGFQSPKKTSLTSSVNEPTNTLDTMNTNELASPGVRLGSYLLESLFTVITLGIGWLIWSFIIWGKGTTPGHQVVRLYVVSEKTGQVFSWGQMFVREILVKGLLIPILSVFSFGIVFLVDSLMVVRDDRKTLHDRICGSIVVQR
jgi:RDD family